MLHEGSGLSVACRHPEVAIDRDYEIRDRPEPTEDPRFCSRPLAHFPIMPAGCPISAWPMTVRPFLLFLTVVQSMPR
ncbi:hypothetical protein GFM01_30410 [Rhizobium laguerreae]|nr:hypothetical protein [Rhizobium laguerreae]